MFYTLSALDEKEFYFLFFRAKVLHLESVLLVRFEIWLRSVLDSLDFDVVSYKTT